MKYQGISSCDALTTFYLGERSRSQKHEDIIILLKRIPLNEANEKMRQVMAILRVKNLVEYEDREFHRKDAQKISLQTERLYKWVEASLPR